MNYLFLSGANNTAKTHDLIILELELQKHGFLRIINKPTYNDDFISLLKKNDGRYVVINSSSDNSTSLQLLHDFLETECKKTDIKINTIITSLRESTDDIRRDFLYYFNISGSDKIVDIPMGRPRDEPKRLASRQFLTNTTLNLIKHLLYFPPYNLI